MSHLSNNTNQIVNYDVSHNILIKKSKQYDVVVTFYNFTSYFGYLKKKLQPLPNEKGNYLYLYELKMDPDRCQGIYPKKKFQLIFLETYQNLK